MLKHSTRRCAKQIFSRAAAPYLEDAQVIAQNAARTFNAITEEHCERWSAAVAELPPLAGGLALLTSHPRSGTTLLEQVLDSHPQLVSADELQILSELVYVPLGQTAASGEAMPAVLDRTGADYLNQLAADLLECHGGGPPRGDWKTHAFG